MLRLISSPRDFRHPTQSPQMKDSSVDTGLKDGNRHFWRVTETSNGLNLSGFFSIESKGLLK